MQLKSATPGKKARIEIIPLIDIMFFLLASFMLVSLSMTRLQKLKSPIEAPEASGVNVPKPDFTPIGIDKDGNLFFDKEGTPMNLTDAMVRLQDMYAKQANKDDLHVFINADSRATYQMVVTVLDKIRDVGIKKVSFPVKKPSGSGQPNSPGAALATKP